MAMIAAEVGAARRPETGLVVRSTGSWIDVLSDGVIVPARVRGKLRLSGEEATNPVAVGDVVFLRWDDDGTALITDRAPRRNSLSRRAAGHRISVEQVLAANLDAVWVIQAVAMPRFNPGFVDRVLVMAEVAEIDVGIVINKMDLAKDRRKEEEIESAARMYGQLGYPVFCMSALKGEGADQFAEALAHKTSILIGPSGAGKSTLLNAIQPGLGLRTSDVSERTQKGTHTTTFAARFELEGGGAIIDTPGLREFGLCGVEADDLGGFFPDFAPMAESCRFYNCTHSHEPGCAVKEAVDLGKVDERRYRSYLSMLDELG